MPRNGERPLYLDGLVPVLVGRLYRDGWHVVAVGWRPARMVVIRNREHRQRHG